MKATRISDESHVIREGETNARRSVRVEGAYEKVVDPSDPAVKPRKPRRMTIAYFDNLLAKSKEARERGRRVAAGAAKPWAPSDTLGFMGAAAAMAAGIARKHYRRGRKGGFRRRLIDSVAPSQTIAKMNAGGAYDVMLDGKVTHLIVQGGDHLWRVERVGRNGVSQPGKTPQEAAARYKLRVDKWA